MKRINIFLSATLISTSLMFFSCEKNSCDCVDYGIRVMNNEEKLPNDTGMENTGCTHVFSGTIGSSSTGDVVVGPQIGGINKMKGCDNYNELKSLAIRKLERLKSLGFKQADYFISEWE